MAAGPVRAARPQLRRRQHAQEFEERGVEHALVRMRDVLQRAVCARDERGLRWQVMVRAREPSASPGGKRQGSASLGTATAAHQGGRCREREEVNLSKSAASSACVGLPPPRSTTCGFVSAMLRSKRRQRSNACAVAGIRVSAHAHTRPRSKKMNWRIKSTSTAAGGTKAAPFCAGIVSSRRVLTCGPNRLARRARAVRDEPALPTALECQRARALPLAQLARLPSSRARRRNSLLLSSRLLPRIEILVSEVLAIEHGDAGRGSKSEEEKLLVDTRRFGLHTLKLFLPERVFEA